ncbi:hypothetical protein [Breznakiella homolactica]|uniref:Uncharacterized protein n=1 Tax=Breznakiella homolactica TaxID=2798577 RepID=A0A7T7XNT3_9SPIR|nr:hypothetical protein [Breznakiella homolactica]QQO09672.1 hypothetical protein JFL75_01770 [Breznakiella homolactica]
MGIGSAGPVIVEWEWLLSGLKASKVVLFERPGDTVTARVLSGLTGSVLPCAGCWV